ncbi:MAG TPA: cytochrome b/b6 domain-containing protein, partial [Acidimicrobiales bacterium]|nr:cytochrome b/b6 domain-containing protein [Acidimicrobiales bacterium]
MTAAPPAIVPDSAVLNRFDRATRQAHWITAALVGLLLLSAAALYIDAISVLVGRRVFVRQVHVIAGLALPFPIVIGMLGRRGTRLRTDLRIWNRWSASDLAWLRSMGRDPFVEHGRFHPAQKLNAAFTGGWIVLMLASGSIMRWFEPFPLSFR